MSDTTASEAAYPRHDGDATLDASRPPYLWALVAWASVFALYAATLAPTAAFWDASEYIATSHILGIPHPPGNPLFIVLGRAWELLLTPFGLSTAVRINLFSAFMSATAHGLWFLVVHHVLRYFSENARVRLIGAGVAVAVSATAFTVWNQSNVNEKVYTVSLLTIALLTWIAFRWQENLGRGKDDNLLVLMAFLLALSVGNHLMAFLAAPAIVLFVLIVHPRTLLNWKLYPAVLVAGLAGLSIHLVLPLRAALQPIINEAAPTCESLGGALSAIATYGNAGCEALSEALRRRQYDKPPLFPRLAPFHLQILNYLQYFDWQWARSLDPRNVLFGPLRLPFTMLFTGLGVWGATEHHRKDRPSFWYFLALFATTSLALVFYLNFKYGYSIPAPVRDVELHEVRERDYFFIVSFSLWGLWAGIGLVSVWQWLGERVNGMARAAPVLAVALFPLVLNARWASRAGDYTARDWGYNLLMSVEPYGVLFTNGDNDTFPLWYVQEVEGIRRDVTVIVTSYLNTPWYAKQIRELTKPCPPGVSPEDDPTRIICQRTYTPENTQGMYTANPEEAEEQDLAALVLAEPPEYPQASVLDLDDETIDRAAMSYVPMTETRAFHLGGGVTSTVRAGKVLYPWHQFLLAIVSRSIGQRPIYFASSGSAAFELGLDQQLIRHGLAFKLSEVPLPEGAPEGVEPLPQDSPLAAVTGAYVDYPRTATLMDHVFMHRSGLPAWDHWPDHATIGIPNYYAWAYWALAQAALQRGDTGASELYRLRAEEWTRLGS